MLLAVTCPGICCWMSYVLSCVVGCHIPVIHLSCSPIVITGFTIEFNALFCLDMGGFNSFTLIRLNRLAARYIVPSCSVPRKLKSSWNPLPGLERWHLHIRLTRFINTIYINIVIKFLFKPSNCSLPFSMK